MTAAILGVPGAGKSKCIKWIKRLFEERFGWEHGVHYQCLAPQNTMAAAIGGNTVHSWACVPINATEAFEMGRRKKGVEDIDRLFLAAQSIRWILIDEITGVSLGTLGTAESNIRRARQRSPFAKRADGSRRPWAGTNLLFFGDFGSSRQYDKRPSSAILLLKT